MKALPTGISILILLVVFFLPDFLLAERGAERWAAGPWQLQEMSDWGSEYLVVDFGANGLWTYDGRSWTQLSVWDPGRITAWGKNNLTVDFGSNGLWNYNGSSWKKIASGKL